MVVERAEEFRSDLGNNGDELGTPEEVMVKVRVRVWVLGEERKGVGGDDEGFAGACVDGEEEEEE